MTELRSKNKFRSNYYLKSFLLGLLLAFIVFIPFILIDGGRFLFYGDFNVQQVPFYQVAHKAIRSGSIGWNQYTDLGANFIGSYSFYLLGSPFFWLTIPFPTHMLQYLMGPLLILKFACATLTSYMYLRRYVKNQNFAILGAVMYAFSGFSIYNIFFNHFHEAIVCFPLLLAALDEHMYHRRRGVFALAVAFCCISNYYFFVGQVTFTLIYFFLRLICRSWRISIRDLILLFIEAVIGLGLSCFLLLPSIYSVLQNDRTSNAINGWNAVLYNKNQRYLHILECMFFPPDLPARPNFTPESESKWASLGAWLPLFGMTGVIGWLQIKRKHWLKKMLWILFLMAFVPFLNASFQLFNSSFYGRWYYMLTLMMALATVMSLEYRPVNWKRAITWSSVITCSIALVIGLMPVITKDDAGESSVNFGLMEYADRFWTYAAIALICIAMLVFLFQFCRSKLQFQRTASIFLCLVSVIYSMYFIALGKTQSLYSYDHIIPYALNGGEDVNLPELRDDNVRVDFYDSLDNSAMFWGVQSIQAFHSIVPGSIMNFYDAIGVQRDVASRPETDSYALRGLTSVKWLFDDDHDDEYFAGIDNNAPLMPGWIYHGNANGFDIWENEYYVPMGFCYDNYVTQESFDETDEKNRDSLMMKAILLDEEQIEKYQGILSELPEENIEYTKDAYLQDCRDRQKLTCHSFSYNNNGFSAEINTLGDGDNLVFFSVPYEDGWTATVNGEAVEIEKVNVGFMAVPVPSGEKIIIDFKFHTPGLFYGLLLTGFSLLALMLYMALSIRKKRNAPKRQEKSKKLLELHSFDEYAKKHDAAFKRPGSMVPKQFVLPSPPQGMVYDGEDEYEQDMLENIDSDDGYGQDEDFEEHLRLDDVFTDEADQDLQLENSSEYEPFESPEHSEDIEEDMAHIYEDSIVDFLYGEDIKLSDHDDPYYDEEQ